jgi:hypothetical protein
LSKHLKHRLTEQEVIDALERYLAREIDLEAAMLLLGLKRRRFFTILKHYREASTAFCLSQPRTKPTRQLAAGYEEKIIQELAREKQWIEDPANPIRFYNYSYIKEQLEEKQGVKVSLPTLIARAKKRLLSTACGKT